MSLRKEKAARLKLAVFEQTLKLIGKRPFDDLYVEDICEKVKISKVTFFKYFPNQGGHPFLLFQNLVPPARGGVEGETERRAAGNFLFV